MSQLKLVARMLAAALIALVLCPAAVFAGGDQVNRPDESGTKELKASGDNPVWAPREQRSAR